MNVFGKRTVDVFPQTLRGKAAQSGADVFVEQEVPTGIEATNAASMMQEDKVPKDVVAMEILSMVWIGGTIDAGGDYERVSLSTISRAPNNPTLDQRGCLGRKDMINLTNGGAGATFLHTTRKMDFTNGGVGRLCVSPKLYIGYDTNGTGSTNTLYWQILYRYVRIPYFEYIGLTEGQITYED